MLYDCQAKLIKIEAAREKLVSLDRLDAMIAGGIAGAIAIMKRLPQLGRNPKERRRLSEFAEAAIREFESGRSKLTTRRIHLRQACVINVTLALRKR